MLSGICVIDSDSPCLNEAQKITIGNGGPVKQILPPINYLILCHKFFLPVKIQFEKIVNRENGFIW